MVIKYDYKVGSSKTEWSKNPSVKPEYLEIRNSAFKDIVVWVGVWFFIFYGNGIFIKKDGCVIIVRGVVETSLSGALFLPTLSVPCNLYI